MIVGVVALIAISASADQTMSKPPPSDAAALPECAVGTPIVVLESEVTGSRDFKTDGLTASIIKSVTIIPESDTCKLRLVGYDPNMNSMKFRNGAYAIIRHPTGSQSRTELKPSLVYTVNGHQYDPAVKLDARPSAMCNTEWPEGRTINYAIKQADCAGLISDQNGSRLEFWKSGQRRNSATLLFPDIYYAAISAGDILHGFGGEMSLIKVSDDRRGATVNILRIF